MKTLSTKRQGHSGRARDCGAKAPGLCLGLFTFFGQISELVLVVTGSEKNRTVL